MVPLRTRLRQRPWLWPAGLVGRRRNVEGRRTVPDARVTSALRQARGDVEIAAHLLEAALEGGVFLDIFLEFIGC